MLANRRPAYLDGRTWETPDQRILQQESCDRHDPNASLANCNVNWCHKLIQSIWESCYSWLLKYIDHEWSLFEAHDGSYSLHLISDGQVISGTAKWDIERRTNTCFISFVHLSKAIQTLEMILCDTYLCNPLQIPTTKSCGNACSDRVGRYTDWSANVLFLSTAWWDATLAVLDSWIIPMYG